MCSPMVEAQVYTKTPTTTRIGCTFVWIWRRILKITTLKSPHCLLYTISWSSSLNIHEALSIPYQSHIGPRWIPQDKCNRNRWPGQWIPIIWHGFGKHSMIFDISSYLTEDTCKSPYWALVSPQMKCLYQHVYSGWRYLFHSDPPCIPRRKSTCNHWPGQYKHPHSDKDWVNIRLYLKPKYE